MKQSEKVSLKIHIAKHIKLVFLYLMIGCLLVAAFIAIVAVLLNTWDDYVYRALMITASIMVHGLLALAFISADTRIRRDHSDVVINTVFGALVGSFVITTLNILDVIPFFVIMNIYYWLCGLVGASGLAALLLNANREDKMTRRISNVSICVLVLMMLQLFPLTLSSYIDFSVGDGIYYRLLIVLAILFGVTTILTVIFNRLYLIKHPTIVQRPYQYEPNPQNPYPQPMPAYETSPNGLVLENTMNPVNPAYTYSANRKNGARDMSIIIALVIVVVVGVSVLGIYGSMKAMTAKAIRDSGISGSSDSVQENTAQEKAVKDKVLKYLEDKYGEKFVVLNVNRDSSYTNYDFSLVCAPESNKELRFAVSIMSEDDDPLDYYIDSLAAEDCKDLIKTEIDKIATNYAIETELSFFDFDIDHPRWKELATADYVISTQQSLRAYIVIDSSSIKDLDYGEEYDVLTGMVSNVLNTDFSIDIAFADSGTVKECREYISDNQTTIYEYDNIVGPYFTHVYIMRNANGTFDPTREEYINTRSI